MSIRYKIALLFSALSSFILVVIFVSVYFFIDGERLQTFRTRLRNRALSTAAVYEGIKDSNFSLLHQLDAAAVASLYNRSITIIGKAGLAEYKFSDKPGDSLSLSAAIIELTRRNKVYYFNFNSKKAVAIYNVSSTGGFIVAIAAADLEGLEFLRHLKTILLLGLLMAFILAFISGIIFAKQLIRPLARIAIEVTQISTNDLSQRIKITGAKDELNRLAQTFNGLLDRLQNAFAIQRRFISNASHELSTPLTSISSQLEVAMQKSRTSGEYLQVMQSIYEDIRELQLLNHSLLDMAKAGVQGSIDLNEVRLDEVLFKAVSDIQKQNRDFKIKIDFESFPEDEKWVSVFGNANLLYIAIKNIIENGCKYSYSKEAAVVARCNGQSFQIAVTNKGDVISESDIQNIFQPFFRADSAKSKPGFGLGLALARRILFLHKGKIEVESHAREDTVFTITLPNAVTRE